MSKRSPFRAIALNTAGMHAYTGDETELKGRMNIII